MEKKSTLGNPALSLVTVPTELHDVWVYYNSHVVMDAFTLTCGIPNVFILCLLIESNNFYIQTRTRFLCTQNIYRFHAGKHQRDIQLL